MTTQERADMTARIVGACVEITDDALRALADAVKVLPRRDISPKKLSELQYERDKSSHSMWDMRPAWMRGNHHV